MRPLLILGGILGGLCVSLHVTAQPSVPPPPMLSVPAAPTLPATPLAPVTPLAPAAPAAAAPAAPVVSQPTVMTITVPDVEVRCGGTSEFYPTSKLRRGDRVQVVRASQKFPGWLEIKPPQGSFSWIDYNFVKATSPNTGVVIAAEDAPVPVMPGSAVVDKVPNVEALRVKRGTCLVLLDKAFKTASGSWYPIEPMPEEVRYLPAEAVKGSSPEAIAPVVTGNGPPGSSRALLLQADQEYSAGRYDQAKQLYAEAAQRSTEYSEKSHCYTRLSQLVPSARPQAATVSQSPGHPGNQNFVQAYTANQTNVRYADNPIKPTASTSASNSGQWSEWGYLRRTGIQQNGRALYVLENQRGQALAYALTTPSLTLEPYVNRPVCLYGTMQYQGDDYVRRNVISVSHVAVP